MTEILWDLGEILENFVGFWGVTKNFQDLIEGEYKKQGFKSRGNTLNFVG